MSQRVEYEALPATRYDQYIPKIRAVTRFVATSGGTEFKPFRDFLRKEGLWDRQKSVVMLSLVDLSWNRQAVTVGTLASQLEEASSDSVAQDLVFERLRKENVLLMKYVLEALDVESGGRLHSVHELYRMVTSYVYPGEYVTLPNFQAWIEWLAATGYIRMIGIRWGLSDKGLEVIQEFTSIDVEELLEDLAEEEAAEAERSEAPAPSADSVEPADVVEPAVIAPEPSEQEDILAGVMPAATPEPVSAPAAEVEAPAPRERSGRAAPVTTSLHPRDPVVKRVSGPTSGAPSAVSSVHPPVALANAPQAGVVVSQSADTALIVDRIKGWYAQWDGWPVLTAQALGIDTGPEGSEGDELLVELAVLAALVEGLPAQPQIFAAARRMCQAGFFAALNGPDGFAAAMASLGDVDDEPWLRTLSERLVHARGIRARVTAEPGLMARLCETSGGVEAVQLLRGALFGGAGTEAPFWVLRELVREGMLDGMKFADATTVPTRRLLANAARIGLVPTDDIASFDGLLAASAAVSVHFGADAGYGLALEVMDRALSITSAGP